MARTIKPQWSRCRERCHKTWLDDGDDEDAIEIGLGEARTDIGPEDEKPAAVLWVPDPEQGSGYREYYIYKQKDKPDRPFGFRKPGTR